MADGKVTILVDVDGKQVKVLNDELDRVTQKGQQGSKSLKDFALGAGVFKIVQAGMNLVSQSLDQAIARFDTLKSFPRVMKAMGHSTEDVERSTKKLADGIEGLPTMLDEVVGTAQRLTSITGDLSKSTNLTLALNNAFLSSGASSMDASRGLQQYSQMLSAGKVDMQSWKTLQETMPYALQKTAESFGFAGTSAQNDFYSALKTGEITFDQFSNKLIELNSEVGGFAELAKSNSEGIGTSFGNLRNAVAKGLATLIDAFDKLSQKVTGKSIANNIDSLKVIVNAGFKVMANSVKYTEPFFKLFFATVKLGITVLKPLSPLLATIAIAFIALKAIQITTAFVKAHTIAVSAFNTVLKLATLNQNVNTASYMAQAGVMKTSTVLYGLITGKITLASLAQIAAAGATGLWTTAVMAFNAAWAANPIGVIVISIAALIAAGTILYNWLNQDSEATKKLKSEQENLIKETDKLTDAVKENAKERAKSIESTTNQTAAYKKMADEVVALAAKTNKTSAEKANLKKKIESLNQSIEGLNLAYDKNTNSLSHNTQQLHERIDAMDAESKWQTAQESLLKIEQERIEINKKLTDVTKQRKEVSEKQDLSDRDRVIMLADLKRKEDELNGSLKANQIEYEKTSAAQQAAAEVMAAAAESGANRQITAYESMSQAQQTAVDNMRNKFQELTDSVTNAFSTIEQQTVISAQQMADNLIANTATVDQWSSNLKILAERGLDQGLIAQLQAAGPKTAEQTQALVDASDAELANLNTAFEEAGTHAKDSFNRSMDALGVEIPDSVRGLVTNIKSGLAAEIASANFTEEGTQVAKGAANGIENSISQVVNSTKKMADSLKQQFQSILGIHSPSKVFTEYGGHITTGLSNGMNNGTSQVTSSAKRLATATKTPFQSLNSQMLPLGIHAMAGFAVGINMGAGSAIAAAQSVASRVKATIKNALDIHSPSRVMRDEVGRFIPQGIAIGIDADADAVEASMQRLKRSMMVNAKPELALGLNQTMSTQTIIKQTSKQSISEKVEVVMGKYSDWIDKALEVADKAVGRPSEMVLDDGTLVAKTGDKFNSYQTEQLRRGNRMRGIVT